MQHIILIFLGEKLELHILAVDILSFFMFQTDENVVVTQFQYNGWPTVEGEVPEVTRGLIELVDQTQNHQEAHGGSGPIAVHCR
jgi:protein tyrosine phosphatase